MDKQISNFANYNIISPIIGIDPTHNSQLHARLRCNLLPVTKNSVRGDPSETFWNSTSWEGNFSLESSKGVDSSLTNTHTSTFESTSTALVKDTGNKNLRISFDSSPSYTEMIASVIMQNHLGRLTVAEIYEAMLTNYGKTLKKRKAWKNSVRHTLSLNECFLKMPRQDDARSCDWTVHPKFTEAFRKGQFKKPTRKYSRSSNIHHYPTQSHRGLYVFPPQPIPMSNLTYGRGFRYQNNLYNFNHEMASTSSSYHLGHFNGFP